MLRIPTHRAPTHPGEMLREEFLPQLGIGVVALSGQIHVPPSVITDLVEERGSITPDLALRLARVFGTTPEFWLNGQMAWDLYHAMHAPEAAQIAEITPLLPLSAGESNAAE